MDKKSFCSCGIPEDDVRLWITSYSTTCKYTKTNTNTNTKYVEDGDRSPARGGLDVGVGYYKV